MIKQAIYIIAVQAAFIVGGGIFVLWYVLSDIRERRKHYRIVITEQESGGLGVYRSKLTERGKEPIVIFPPAEKLILQIDVQMLDAVVKITDVRPGR
jgi:hypothetical protein